MRLKIARARDEKCSLAQNRMVMIMPKESWEIADK
jgi:hypothetical protein